MDQSMDRVVIDMSGGWEEGKGEEALQEMRERGFVVLRMSSQVKQAAMRIKSEIGPMLADPKAYPEMETAIHPEGANVGYVRGTLRDFLKLRRDDPSNTPSPDVSNVYSTFFDALLLDEENGGGLLDLVEEMGRVGDSPLGPEEWVEVREAVSERSSVGLIRYKSVEEEQRKGCSLDESSEFADLGDGTFCVCSEHRDTGIVTGVVVGSVPGLQVVDQTTGEWISVESEYAEHMDEFVVLMPGEKAPMFVDSRITPVTHRVVVPSPTEPRYSLLLFMDTVKV